MLLGSNKWEYAYYLLFNNMHGTEQYRKKIVSSDFVLTYSIFYFLKIFLKFFCVLMAKQSYQTIIKI